MCGRDGHQRFITANSKSPNNQYFPSSSSKPHPVLSTLLHHFIGSSQPHDTCGSAGKESARNAGNLGSIPGLKTPGGGKGYLLRYSGLENSTDCIDHGVSKSQNRLSEFHNPMTQELLSSPA